MAPVTQGPLMVPKRALPQSIFLSRKKPPGRQQSGSSVGHGYLGILSWELPKASEPAGQTACEVTSTRGEDKGQGSAKARPQTTQHPDPAAMSLQTEAGDPHSVSTPWGAWGGSGLECKVAKET